MLVIRDGKIIVDSPWTPLHDSAALPEGQLVTSAPYHSTRDVSDHHDSDSDSFDPPSSNHDSSDDEQSDNDNADKASSVYEGENSDDAMSDGDQNSDHDISDHGHDKQTSVYSDNDSSGSVSYQHTAALDESFSFQCSGESSSECKIAFGSFLLDNIGSITLYPDIAESESSHVDSSLCKIEGSSLCKVDENTEVLMEISSELAQNADARLIPVGRKSSDERRMTMHTSFNHFEDLDDSDEASDPRMPKVGNSPRMCTLMKCVLVSNMVCSILCACYIIFVDRP